MTRLADRFGSAIDPGVAYGRGRILAGEGDETLGQRHGHALIRQRVQQHGHDGVHNLTGLIRGFPLAAGDDERLRSYIHFNAWQDGRLERLALKILGGDAGEHDGFLATRVSAGIRGARAGARRPRGSPANDPGWGVKVSGAGRG